MGAVGTAKENIDFVNVSTLFNFHPACIFDDRTTLAVQSFDCYESR